MSMERLIHLIAGAALALLYFRLVRAKLAEKITLSSVVVLAIGTWVSDWDLFFGIGYHRSPISHSLLPAIIFALLLFFAPMRNKLPILTAFSLGLASHLLWDIVIYGNVLWIKGGNNDRLFLFFNAALLIITLLLVNSQQYASYFKRFKP